MRGARGLAPLWPPRYAGGPAWLIELQHNLQETEARLHRELQHYATKADLKDTELRLGAEISGSMLRPYTKNRPCRPSPRASPRGRGGLDSRARGNDESGVFSERRGRISRWAEDGAGLGAGAEAEEVGVAEGEGELDALAG